MFVSNLDQDLEKKEGLAGGLLIAMPQMTDPRFFRAVIYVCAHSAEGAMGIVINKHIHTLTFPDLLTQLGIHSPQMKAQAQIHFGGPVEPGRGFVLHSNDYHHDASVEVGNDLALTATIDVLRAIAFGEGPKKHLLALGYAGWGPGQLEAEIQANGWLHVPANAELIFETDVDKKWERSMEVLGVQIDRLVSEFGHA